MLSNAGAIGVTLLKAEKSRAKTIANAVGTAAITGFATTRTNAADRLATGAIATGINTGIALKGLEKSANAEGLQTGAKIGQLFAVFGLPLAIVTVGLRKGLERVVEHTRAGADHD
ncbi:hypothetical protein J2S70_000480 [Trueperella bonasi]|uniref:Uncharacterized protein n=1 Tax=Trueperella bonasi TaxID=312286 RepID=A0ABT9NES8_9ACTO|nr:hypothetical protein [Trueperella bonasi]MDP9805898.1 hypothetical protein [Trueperella bonasi]